MPSPPKPHPDNAPGAFYVEDGCCTACGVTVDVAPDVFSWVEGPEHTYCVVAHQPRTADALDRTLVAMWSGELDCVRYRGSDPDILRRIAEMDMASLCDHPPPANVRPLWRSHVSFCDSAGALGLANSFVEHFGQGRHRAYPSKVRGNEVSAMAEVSWFEKAYHAVMFEVLEDGRRLAIAVPSDSRAGIGLSRTIEVWLHDRRSASEIRWYSAEQWAEGGSHQPTVV
jgi:hypothetical protein